MRFGIWYPLRRGALALAENSLDARDVAPHLAHPRRVFELAAGALETQVENFLAEGVELFGQLILAARAQIAGFPALHGCASSPVRVTKRVAIGNFAAAKS